MLELKNFFGYGRGEDRRIWLEGYDLIAADEAFRRSRLRAFVRPARRALRRLLAAAFSARTKTGKNPTETFPSELPVEMIMGRWDACSARPQRMLRRGCAEAWRRRWSADAALTDTIFPVLRRGDAWFLAGDASLFTTLELLRARGVAAVRVRLVSPCLPPSGSPLTRAADPDTRRLPVVREACSQAQGMPTRSA